MMFDFELWLLSTVNVLLTLKLLSLTLSSFNRRRSCLKVDGIIVHCSQGDKFLEVSEPLHVKSLVLVKCDALNKRAQVLVDPITTQVFCESCLDALIKSWEVWTSILGQLAFKSVDLSIFVDVVTHLHVVESHFGINAGCFNNHAFLSVGVRNDDRKIAVILGLLLLLLLTFLLFFLWLLIWHGLSVDVLKLACLLTLIQNEFQQVCLQQFSLDSSWWSPHVRWKRIHFHSRTSQCLQAACSCPARTWLPFPEHARVCLIHSR